MDAEATTIENVIYPTIFSPPEMSIGYKRTADIPDCDPKPEAIYTLSVKKVDAASAVLVMVNATVKTVYGTVDDTSIIAASVVRRFKSASLVTNIGTSENFTM